MSDKQPCCRLPFAVAGAPACLSCSLSLFVAVAAWAVGLSAARHPRLSLLPRGANVAATATAAAVAAAAAAAARLKLGAAAAYDSRCTLARHATTACCQQRHCDAWLPLRKAQHCKLTVVLSLTVAQVLAGC